MALVIDRNTETEREVLALKGDLRIADAGRLLHTARKSFNKQNQIIIDLTQLNSVDTAGIATLAECLSLAQQAGKLLQIRGAQPDIRAQLERVPEPAAINKAESPSFPERIGQTLIDGWHGAGSFVQLLADTLYWCLVAPLRRRLPPPGATTEQAVRIGVDAVPIVCLISFLLGLITAFQSAHQLRQFGANIFVANLVGVSMVRELGPLITAIIVAGRSGSAIAAELGTMTVGEEIDALRTMGIDPIRFLVVPRVYAISITQPALALFAMAVGIFGGFLIAVLYLDLSAVAYLKQTVSALDIGALLHGLSKSLLFAWVIALIGCHYGFRITGGAAGVGRSTTNSVVVSIFAIIVVDSIFTTLATLL